MRPRLLLLPLLALGACGDVAVEDVVLRLTVDAAHRCEGKGLSSSYGLGVYGVYLLMQNSSTNQIYSECVNTFGVYDHLEQLQERLGKVAFNHVQSGTWGFWVLGSDNRCWTTVTQTRLCGTTKLLIPPTTSPIAVPVSCEDPFSDQVTLEEIKRQIKDCRITMPWLP